MPKTLEFRDWSERKGGTQRVFHGAFVGLENSIVKIKPKEGRVRSMLITDLSKPDQEYVKDPIITNKLPSGEAWNFPVGFGLRCYEDGRDIERDVRGDWLKVNGEGIYATRPWKKVAEGIDVDQLRTVAFNKRRGEMAASWRFQTLEASRGQAVRFTRSKDYSRLYAFVIGPPEGGSVTIETLRKGNVDKQGEGIRRVSLLGSDAPRERLDDPIERKGNWPVFRSTR